MKVIDYKKVNLDKILYQEPTKTAGGCLISRTNYQYQQDKIPILIQTPRLKVSSDLEILDNKTYLELELDKKHINFYEFINNIDDQNISKTFLNSEDWFQEKLPMDVVDDFYKTNIKMRKYNKSPIIKFKIPIYKNKSRKSCDIFGEDLKPVDVCEIKKNTEVICILELEGIKFFKQRFETEWKVLQLRVYPEKQESMPCLINEEFLSDHEEIPENDAFPEDAISLNSSIESNSLENKILNNTDEVDILEDESLVNKEEDIDKSSVKNIEINMNQENKTNSDSLVKVEKIEENLSLEIKPNETQEQNDSVETIDNQAEIKEDTELENKNIIIPEISNPESDNLDNNNGDSNNNQLENNDTNNNELEDSDIEGNDSEREDIDNEETDSDSERMTSDTDLEDGDVLDDYYSDNFTDEEEICDGLENDLEEINFVETEELDLSNFEKNTSSLEESNSQSVAQESKSTDIEEENYENKSVEELISEIAKFKKLALDRENEMTELKSKYRNLFSELNL